MAGTDESGSAPVGAGAGKRRRGRKRRLVLRALLVFLALIVLGVAGLLGYLAHGDLSRLAPLVERIVTGILARELTIGGSLTLDELSLTPRVVVENVSLANPSWNREPAMIHVDWLSGVIDLRSLLAGPVRIRDVKIRGARVVLEERADGPANWFFDIGDPSRPKPPSPTPRPFLAPVLFDHVHLEQGTLVYRDATRDLLVVEVTRLEAGRSEADEMEVRLAGTINDTEVEVAGTGGPYTELWRAGRLDHDLTGRLGQIDFAVSGTMGRLANLGSPEERVRIKGPGLEDVSRTFSLPHLDLGAFRLTGRTSPDADVGVTVELDVVGERLSATAGGLLETLLRPGNFDLRLTTSGPDVDSVAELAGVEDLPGGPFHLSGRVTRDDDRFLFEGVEGAVAGTTLEADGVLVPPPNLNETDFRLRVEGTDLSVYSKLAGLDLPPDPFGASGRLQPMGDGMRLEQTEVRIGELVVSLEGVVGDDLTGTKLDFRGSSPDLAPVELLAGIDLPDEAFEIEGEVTYDGSGIGLGDVTAELGGNRVKANGTLVPVPGLHGTDARVEASGPDLADLVGRFDVTGVPTEPFEVSGRVRVSRQGYRLEAVQARVGPTRLSVDGQVIASPGLVGSEVEVSASGPDLSDFAELAGTPALPERRFSAAGHVDVTAEGYDLEGVELGLGEIEASVSGRLGAFPDLEGTRLDVAAVARDLSEISEWIDLELPAESVEVRGSVHVDSGVFRSDRVEARLGSHDIEVSGAVGPFPALDATELWLRVSGGDLSDAGRIVAAAGVEGVPPLPAEAYSLEGTVRGDEAGYEIEEVRIHLGEAWARLDGRVGEPPDFFGTDVTVEAHGPDASLIGDIAELPLAPRPFRVAGGVERTESGFRFRALEIGIADRGIQAHGTLGEPPRFVGTDLDLRVSGENLAVIGQMFDLERFPETDFDARGHFDGTPDQFSLRDFEARVGDSDVSGSFAIDLRARPELTAEFASNLVDVNELLGWQVGPPPDQAPEQVPDPSSDQARSPDPAGGDASGKKGKGTGAKTDPKKKSQPKRDRRVLSQEPIDLTVLDALNGSIRWTARNFKLAETALDEIELSAELRDGRLQVHRAVAGGHRGGRFSVGLLIEPFEGETTRFSARATADQIRPGLYRDEENPQDITPIDLDVSITAVGTTPHELATSADGWVVISAGEGLVNNSAVRFLAADVLYEIFSALNPFAKEETGTRLECANVVLDFDNGVARLEALAVRTDKLTIVGQGRVRFDNEHINVEWAAKPRKGIGLSASAITNPYLKLGGTLSDPALELKPLEAAATTGMAVATVGLSILARGLWDRFTAEKKVCKKATREAEKLLERKRPLMDDGLAPPP